MKVVNIGDIKVLKFEMFERYDFLDHCFTSRIGGNSTAPFDSLNMGIHGPEDIETVKSNYDKLAKQVFKSNLENYVLSCQNHGVEVAIVNEEDMGRGMGIKPRYEGVDGLVTDKVGPLLSTIYADCTPLFFVDVKKRVVAVAHSGWKGAVGRIGERVIESMKSEYGSDVKDIMVGIASTIGSCCYEVKEDVAGEFKKSFKDCSKILMPRGNETYSLDLWEANKQVVIDAGVLEENIEVDDHCTKCNEDLFYSYRRDKKRRGSMAALIKLNY
jgi:polyphenol oxidase